ncbi:hypothetical protein GQ600_22679 [Phytophthora cactorum]|nr:hypothetical protein GQ600_22679 [Phytophthora cactorum]
MTSWKDTDCLELGEDSGSSSWYSGNPQGPRLEGGGSSPRRKNSSSPWRRSQLWVMSVCHAGNPCVSEGQRWMNPRATATNDCESHQNDWDDHAERLMLALNTSFDAIRLDAPFYLVAVGDAQGTSYEKAKCHRAVVRTAEWKALSERLKAGFEKGDSVWLYIPRVQPGLSQKLAHMGHGSFRIDEVHDDFRVKLMVNTGYRVNPA